jgi:hypothetical protein
VTGRLRGDAMMNLSATVLVVLATGLPIPFMLLVLSPKPGVLLGPVPRRPNACECPCAPRPPPVEPTIAQGGDLALPTPGPTPPPPALPSSLSSRTGCLLKVGTKPCKSNEINLFDGGMSRFIKRGY